MPPCSVDEDLAHEHESLVPVSRFLPDDIKALLEQMCNFTASFPSSSLPASLPRYLFLFLWLYSCWSGISCGKGRRVRDAMMYDNYNHRVSAAMMFSGLTASLLSAKTSYQGSRCTSLQPILCRHLDTRRLTSLTASLGRWKQARSKISWNCSTLHRIRTIQSGRSRFVLHCCMSWKWSSVTCIVRTGHLEPRLKVANLQKYMKSSKIACHFLIWLVSMAAITWLRIFQMTLACHLT